MASNERFFLKLNDFPNSIMNSFRTLRNNKTFEDVTLACEGQSVRAHIIVLCACSPYFKSIIEQNPSHHPVIILNDVPYVLLQALLEFMYQGEVNLKQEELVEFLKIANRLMIKGLTELPDQIKME